MESRNIVPGNATFAFFLSDRSRGLHSATSILRTIAYFMIGADKSLLHLFSELQEGQRGKQNVKNRKSLEILVENLISAKTLKRVYLIIDGVDEIDNTERMPLIDFLIDLSKRHPQSISVLISSREEWDIKAKLVSYPRITVNEKNGKDIAHYVAAEKEALISKFHPHLSVDEARHMLQPLPLKSDGNYPNRSSQPCRS